MMNVALIRKITRPRVAAALAPLLLLLLSPAHAAAELGGSVQTIERDSVLLGGTHQVTHAEGYDLHEIKTSNGANIREYVSLEGKVFAVAWSAHGHPDARQLLGSYFQQYQSALQSQRGRGPVSIHEPGLVVELAGHSRAFTGKVLIPALMPAGVDPQAIH